MYMNIHISLYIYIYIYIHIHTDIHTYTHTHIHTYTHIHTHTHTHMHTCTGAFFFLHLQQRREGCLWPEPRPAQGSQMSTKPWLHAVACVSEVSNWGKCTLCCGSLLSLFFLALSSSGPRRHSKVFFVWGNAGCDSTKRWHDNATAREIAKTGIHPTNNQHKHTPSLCLVCSHLCGAVEQPTNKALI